MTTPSWIDSVVRDFGRGAGLRDFALNGRGVAAVRFENGRALRFEFTGEELVVALTVPAPNTPETARRALAFAHPLARTGVRVRAGYLEKAGAAAFAVRLPESEATLPAVERAFDALWRIGEEIGGAA